MAAVHGQVLSHLVRRGVDMMQSEPALPAISMDMDRDDLMQTQQNQLNMVFSRVPIWGIVMLGLTALVFYLLFLSLSYTIGRVIMTLAMIETPTVDYVPLSSLENLDAKSKATLIIDGEPHIVEKNRPITSKIRGTLRHLTTHCGWTARWRGLGFGMLYTFCNAVVYTFCSALLFWLPVGGHVIAAILAAVITAQVHCAWTHKMISVASDKSYLARIPSRSVWRQLWIPNAIASASCQGSILLVAMLGVTLGRGVVHEGDDQTPPHIANSFGVIVAKIIAVLVLSFFLGFFVVLPNYAALTRIEATLLPDEEDTIVPFDRTFGGKVTPVVVGGSGFNYVKEVCRTFDSEARSRIMKLFFKGMGIAFALIILYVHVISFEVFFIIGPLARQAAKEASMRMMMKL